MITTQTACEQLPANEVAPAVLDSIPYSAYGKEFGFLHLWRRTYLFHGGYYETQLTLAQLFDGSYGVSVRYYITG